MKRLVARLYRRGASLLARPHNDIVLSKELVGSDDRSSGTPLQVAAFEDGDPGFFDSVPHVDSFDMELLRIYARRGYRALFAQVDGRLVGHMWWVDGQATGPAAHPHLARYDVRLGPRDAWAFNFFLDPRYRGGGNANRFLGGFEEHLRNRGFERVWGVVASENKPARWLYSLCAWRPLKVVRAVEVAGGVLFSQTGVYVRNSRRGNGQAHDYRRVAAWRRAPPLQEA